ncbi:SIMPL domain-containing protein [Gilvimarinus sp. F26214L]|uniref:SIMPL domain-containing protein n=1 Tax=Gilvimarinus sp. DZF01 TaxID=3461371 RepID=UPI004045E620
MFRLISLVVLLSIGLPALAEGDDSLIHVTGQASIDAAPDQAEVRFEVVQEGETVESLKADVDRAVAKVIEVAERLGIERRDVQAASLAVHPNYHHNNKTGERTLSGMTVRRTIDVTVRKLETYPELIDAALKAGVNQMSQVTLSVADSSKLQERAIRAAVDDAMTKARVVADQVNLSVGRIRDLRATSNHSGPTPRVAYAAFSSGSGESFREGQVSVAASVALSIELVEAD